MWEMWVLDTFWEMVKMGALRTVEDDGPYKGAVCCRG